MRLLTERAAIGVHVCLVAMALSGLVVPLPLMAQGPFGPAVETRDPGPPDPCTTLLDIPGQANGLHRRCSVEGKGGGVAKGDFNGDGIGDLAIGVPFEGINGQAGAGAVNVIYGSPAGLTATGNQFWHQDSSGVPGTAEAGDHFGYALAAGDFDKDGYSDLAIGAPDEDLGGVPDAGVVDVLFGGPSGLTASRAQSWDMTNDEVATMCGVVKPGVLGDGCRFGAALVWADFNKDGVGDLAVGMPNDNDIESAIFVGYVTHYRVGSVQVLYGVAGTGLSVFGTQRVSQHRRWGEDDVLAGDFTDDEDRFGETLTAGDFNGDGFSDLVIGVGREDGPNAADGGMVNVVYGASTGLRVNSYEVITQDSVNMSGGREPGDRFGWAVAAGDFDGDGFGDLAVGVPYEDLSGLTDVGAVQVIYGSSHGLATLVSGPDYLFRTEETFSVNTNQFWSQGPIAGVDQESGDRFGFALAAGKFNADSYADLAVGVPGEDIGGVSNSGMVNVLAGSSSGITSTGAQSWHLDVSGVTGVGDVDDQLGYSLTAWNFGNSSQTDLAIGIPFKNLVSSSGTLQVNAGAVLVLYGSSNGLTSAGNQLWTQDSPGILDAAEAGDRFGNAVY